MFLIITKVTKKNSGVVVVQDTIIIYMACKNKHRSTTVLEEILLDLHHQIISIFSKKVIRINTEN